MTIDILCNKNGKVYEVGEKDPICPCCGEHVTTHRVVFTFDQYIRLVTSVQRACGAVMKVAKAINQEESNDQD